ncbi:MAG: Gfo/Idh/MocA family oxidoreductase [Bacteroidia bacterium]|nr:Gfo/Idh/MocA family oxidoreductase [Bacteroidia bacterium]
MIMEKNLIKFAVIGTGHIGKRHAAMIQRNSSASLVAVCDIRPQSETGFEADGVPYFSSVEEMLQSVPEIEVVVVATPNGLHEQHALQALEASKHVVIEKPMALTKAGCEKIIFKALQVSRQVFCVMQNRYSPPSIWIKEVLDQKLLGQIFMVQVNCYWNRDDRYYKPDNWKGDQQLDGGTLFTQFSHFVDIMYWLFGDIKNIQARFNDFTHKHNTDFEDSGIATFEFVEGGMGVLNYSTAIWNQNLESSLTIIGEKGSVKIGGQYMNEVEVCKIEGYEMPVLPPSNPANDYGHYKGSAANHVYIIENVVETLNGETTITTNAMEGLKVVDIIERIYELRPEGLVKQKGGKLISTH